VSIFILVFLYLKPNENKGGGTRDHAHGRDQVVPLFHGDRPVPGMARTIMPDRGPGGYHALQIQGGAGDHAHGRGPGGSRRTMVIGWCPGANCSLVCRRNHRHRGWPDDYAGPGTGCDQGDLLPSSFRAVPGIRPMAGTEGAAVPW
jgi:hypothetical protein